MKQFGKSLVWLMLVTLFVACTQQQVEVVEVTRVELIEQTVTPIREAEIVVSRDLFLRATEVVVTLEPTVRPIVAPTRTSTPTPPLKELIVCQAAEPDSLYMFGSNMLDGQNVRHAIYEPLYTNLSYDYQAVGLEKLPSLADGDALLQPVEVQTGDTIVDAEGNVVTLLNGVSIINSESEIITFNDLPVMMNHMMVDFTFKPLVWSDGKPMSAQDSVFSFEINAETEDPFGSRVRNEDLVARTAVYEATGPLSVRWTGLPGYHDQTYFLNVWQPLPRHQLGEFTAAELLDAEETVRRPLSTGPFVVSTWTPGEFIRVVHNPHYYRQRRRATPPGCCYFPLYVQYKSDDGESHFWRLRRCNPKRC